MVSCQLGLLTVTLLLLAAGKNVIAGMKAACERRRREERFSEDTMMVGGSGEVRVLLSNRVARVQGWGGGAKQETMRSSQK